MGWLTALPQFFGAWVQLLSVWLGSYFRRRYFVVFAAGLQALVVALMSLLAALSTSRAVTILIILAIFYHATMNLVQPLWRAWMGSIVPPRRRGVFFASRTRLTMITSLVIFIGGGAMLSLSEAWGISWVGFSILFATAACGRALSSSLLFRMHDPDPHQTLTESGAFQRTFVQIRESFGDKTFRDYSLFVAGMHGVVAVSAPFFAVYQCL